jgi:uroporphyrinogen III methyltransferase/synthase
MNTPNGKVYLIGAGPGDPGLITVKGLAALREADAILYDRLAPAALLDDARPDALRIDVGKGPKHHAMSQEQINDRLVALAREGKIVARLKGGDPFVFGRGGEEAEACRVAGIPFVIIPGVSSAIAVPAYAGIPVTHRDFSGAFTVITGHEDPSHDSRLDYAALAKIGTLVFMMSVGHLDSITHALLAAGRNPETPVACIERGTTPHQRIITGTLATIAHCAAEQKLTSPAIIVIGEVAGLHDRLAWWDGTSV